MRNIITQSARNNPHIFVWVVEICVIRSSCSPTCPSFPYLSLRNQKVSLSNLLSGALDTLYPKVFQSEFSR